MPWPFQSRPYPNGAAPMPSCVSLGAAGLAFLLHHSGYRTAAFAQSAVLLMLTMLTFFIRERPGDSIWPAKQSGLNTQSTATTNDSQPLNLSFGPLFRQLIRALLAAGTLLLFLSIAVVFIGERLFQRVYFFSLIRDLGWNDASVSILSGTYGTVLAVALALVGGWLADQIGAYRMLMGVTVTMALLHISFAFMGSLWSNQDVATAGLIIRQTLEPVFSIAALPVLMGLCQRGIEGAQFAVYMALGNQADIAGIYLSGQLLPLFSAPAIGLLCGGAMLGAAVIVAVLFRQSRQPTQMGTVY